MRQSETEVLQGPAQEIELDERAEVADVSVVVDGRTARVHPNFVVAEWNHFANLLVQRVVQFEHDNCRQNQ